MIIETKIFLIGLAIFIFGRVLAQLNNNNAANKLLIGSIVGAGMVVAFIGGITWIVNY